MMLGLAGCPAGDDTTETSACLNVDPTVMPTTDTGADSSGSDSGSDSGSTGSDSGSTGSDSGSTGTTFGPCLDVAPTTTGGETDTDTDTGTGSGTSGGQAAQPQDVRERVIDRLPADVAAKLRGDG